MGLMIDDDRVELLGVEIIFTGEDDPRGSIWIDFNESLSFLYGVNGAGKSTIIKAIAAFIKGISLEESGILLHGYARLLDPDKSCSIIDQAVNSMRSEASLFGRKKLGTSEVSAEFDIMVAALNLPHRKWEPSLFSSTPDSLSGLDITWSNFASHYLCIGLWSNDFQCDLPSIKSFTQHLIDEKIFCLRPTGRNNTAEWHVSLAAKMINPEVRDAYEILQNSEFDFFDEDSDNHVAQIIADRNILTNDTKMPRTNAPFISAARLANQKITSLDISLVDLNEEFDLEQWTKRRISEIVHSGWVTISDPWFAIHANDPSPTSMFSDIREVGDQLNGADAESEVIWSATFGLSDNRYQFDFFGRRRTILQKTLTFIARELPEEIAITDLRIWLEYDLGRWIFNRPGTLEAFDQRSSTWIPVSSTSSATQKIIGMALQIHSAIRSSKQVVIAIGDEIDGGLHDGAIDGLYRMLANSITTCFIATHNPNAISTQIGERLNVERGVTGEIVYNRINNSDFRSTSASSFGVRDHLLNGMVDLVVAVEGLHDRLVLEHFIERDERLANSYINVISISGVSNAPNLLDIHFRLLTTDLRILVVADNTSKTDLAERWLHAIQQIRAGESPSKIAKDLRAYAFRLKKQGWFEQRRMIELLAEATERDLVDRLRMSGHTYADIEMALEPRLFNLDKDWLELEVEFNEFKTDAKSTGKNFKDFLFSTYGVRIDEKSIKAALSKTDKAPAGIKLVIDDIVANAFRTGLNYF